MLWLFALNVDLSERKTFEEAELEADILNPQSGSHVKLNSLMN